MATSTTCDTVGCSEYGVEKFLFGGGEIDETIPTICGVCGTLLLGSFPAPSSLAEPALAPAGVLTWQDVPADVTYHK